MNSYLETGIAIVLIFFVFSTVAYVIQELIAINFKYRGKMLKSSLEQLVTGNNIREELFEHPQLKLLKENLNKLPSYIPSANFAMAVMDIVASKSNLDEKDGLLNNFKNGLSAIQNSNGDLSILLKNLADSSTDITQLQLAIEKWFNEYMDRVSGWYKRKYRWVTRLIAIGIALGFNIDMVSITQTIYNNPVLRATMVARAEHFVDQSDSVAYNYYNNKFTSNMKVIKAKFGLLLNDSTNKKNKIDSLKKAKEAEESAVLEKHKKELSSYVKSLIKDISNDKLVFGWERSPFKIIDAKTNILRYKHFSEYLLSLLGLFIGAVAISMGAPFWFEIMVKLINVRRTGIKPKDVSE